MKGHLVATAALYLYFAAARPQAIPHGGSRAAGYHAPPQDVSLALGPQGLTVSWQDPSPADDGKQELLRRYEIVVSGDQESDTRAASITPESTVVHFRNVRLGAQLTVRQMRTKFSNVLHMVTLLYTSKCTRALTLKKVCQARVRAVTTSGSSPWMDSTSTVTVVYPPRPLNLL